MDAERAARAAAGGIIAMKRCVLPQCAPCRPGGQPAPPGTGAQPQPFVLGTVTAMKLATLVAAHQQHDDGAPGLTFHGGIELRRSS